MEHNLKDLARLIYSLGSFQALLFENNISSEKLEELFSPPESQDSSFGSVVSGKSLTNSTVPVTTLTTTSCGLNSTSCGLNSKSESPSRGTHHGKPKVRDSCINKWVAAW
ncbi:hypothetical protein QL285_000175 [Trifolium repens]|nr:hypothetical protein QL285_000175 [Trifolium repens]